MTSEARIETETPGRYIRQLCSHFAHRVPATYSEESGRIEFEMGVCTLAVDGNQLVLTAQADEADGLREVEEVVGKHVERFAWRESPQVSWQPVN